MMILSVLFVFGQEKSDNDTIKGPPLPCIAPTSQANTFVATATGSTTIDLTWARGDGDNVIILAHAGSAVDADPISGNAYGADATFGAGVEIGTGNFVVYNNNTPNNVTVTGLTAGITYHFAIYEFYDLDICYLTPGATANATTDAASPTISSVTDDFFFADKGKTITIAGTNLGGMGTTVTIAGVTGTNVSNDGSTLVVTFPAGLYTNNTLTVATGSGTDATSTVTVNTRNVIPVGGGTDSHATIQSALDGLAAWFTTSSFNTSTAGYLSGTKTIDVYNGTYTENVTPNITLGTTVTENLIIQNHLGEAPIVDASGLANAFNIGALDYVHILGFTAYGSTADVIYTEGDKNLIKYNKVYGSTGGSGILLNSSVSTIVLNNLIYDNNQFGVRLIASNNVILDNNTLANNGNESKAPPLPGLYEPAQLYVESGTGISVENNIFYAKSGTAIFTIKTESGSTITSNYNTYFKNGNNFLVNYEGAVYVDLAGWTGNGAGTDDIDTDPDFVIAGTDFHIKSTFGSYPFPAQWPPMAAASAWNNDASDSPALDTGNPADAFALEPAAGGRINQGAYGNTAQASKSVACVYPNTQATNFNATPDVLTMDISWTRGDGDFVIVLAHQGAAVDANPIDGTTYTANAAFGLGDEIGTGNFVVYIGALTAEIVTALTSNTNYQFAVYEFLDANKCYLVPPLTGTSTTLDCAPTTQATLMTGTPTVNSINLGWTRGNGDNVIVLAHESAAVDSDPLSGTTYTADANFSGAPEQIGVGNYVVYNGSATSVNVTGLATGTTYHFAIYEYNDLGTCYLIPGLTGNYTTLVASPTITSVTDDFFFADKGKTITIVGTNLGGMGTTVTIAGVTGTNVSNDGSTLVVTFPAGLYTNNTLTVATGSGTDATSTVTVNTRNIIPVGGGTDSHATIQSALDGLAAWFTTSAFNTSTAGYLSGSKTIDVYTGTYNEKVVPNVNLGTSVSEHLIIQNHSGESPIVDASGETNAFYIGALDYVQIIGFTAHSSIDAVIYTEGANNIIVYNKIYGSSAGPGILLNSAPTSVLLNNLIYDNYNFGIRLISSNNVTVINNTIANNGHSAKGPPLPGGIYDPSELYVESGTGVNVKNNIIYAKAGISDFCLKTEVGITVISNYNTYFKNGNANIVYYNGSVYADIAAWTGNGAGTDDIDTDPDFVTAGTDFHIKSANGSYHFPDEWPPVVAAGVWTLDGSTSTALDAGDPADGYANEPVSGSRINQGAYGNTAQASKSVGLSWDGSTSTAWQDVTNWTPEQIPTAINDIIIPDGCPNYPVLTTTAGTAVCNNMTIEAIDASVTVAADGQMTVSGSITNNRGIDGLIIKSDASGDGSLIVNNAVEATVERFVTGNSWHLMYPALSAIPTSIYTVEGSNTNYNFYSYSEPNEDYWDATLIYETSGWTSEVATANIPTDKGYLFNRYNSPDKTFVQTGGNLEFANKVFDVSYTISTVAIANGVTQARDYFDGWNLAGNPYSSAIDWDEVILNGIESGIYYFDGLNYQYYMQGDASATTPYDIGITLNGGSQFIPSGQGFMVKVTNTGSSHNSTFTIPVAAKVHDNQAFWKETVVIPNFLKLNIEKNGFTDEMVIRTLPAEFEVTEEHDAKFDAHKMFAWGNTKPQVYSRNDDNTNIYSINSMPEIDDSKIIPLGMYIGDEGQYTINFLENNFEGYDVYLHDISENKYVRIYDNTFYTFNSEVGTFSDRFEIIFKKNNSFVIENSLKFISVFPNPAKESIFINVGSEITDYKTEILTITGQVIYSNKFYGNETSEIKLNNISQGVYILKIIFDDNSSLTKKLVIE